jgi:[calcium/calmodulin-dependent protein kinase] kinase
VTKRGADPLLSAEENTADLVEPPTEEEMNHAITGNMGNLLVVMKAARKFKKLVSSRRPNIMESFLGGDQLPLVTPPLSMSDHRDSHHLFHKSHSVETYDRRPLEQILVAEGVHRDIDLNNLKKSFRPSHKMDPALSVFTQPTTPKSKDNIYDKTEKEEAPPDQDILASPDALQPPNPINAVQSPTAMTPMSPRPWEQDGNRGHAHDPLEERLFLHIGPSSFTGPSSSGGDGGLTDDPDQMIVSESPGAAESDIYETAYREEIERIRSRSQNATVYLTRRVESKKAMGQVEKLVSGILAAGYASTKEEGGEAVPKQTETSPEGDGGSQHQIVVQESEPEKVNEFNKENESITKTSPEPSPVNAPQPQLENQPAPALGIQPAPTEPSQSKPAEAEAPVPTSATSTPPPEPLISKPEQTSPSPTPSDPESSTSKMRRLSRGGFKGLMGKIKGKVR